ncbi:ribosome quality control complex subunit 2 [Colletotrichum spaethianum]|uniref:Ribosome quality control complex subunit 2 n=1 Tax=Colletotrichum spaethianum TaxID=700344 RepID=A0AA37LF68_9PEZI|nr:ribosome quality control complex subunit 2 [Colletotrichum spaethianum]GKT47206.1 ribosome quality control complex subunit 2 [Colletotrichum spaethianum]
MSSRQLRKLQKQRELEQLQETKPATEESSDDEPEPATIKPRQSLFAALGGGDDDGDDNDDEKSDNGQDEAQPESEPEVVPQPAKKKNKKKKKKAKKAATQDGPANDREDEDDEIDRALKELSIARNAGSTASDNLAQRSRDIDDLLQINTQYLRAINEMRALFGKEAIQAAQEEERAELEAARRAQRGANQHVDLETALRGDPRKKLPEISLRRNVFIQGKDTWPRATAAGLVMKEIRKGSDGLTEFAFVHEQAYDNVQVMFFSCVQLGDPMQMVQLLMRFPYHVSTLLQVSKVAIQDQNQALAADLCERALFTFGRATTSAFRQKLEQGKARLDFRRPENRELWLAGYTYLKSLIRKGTYRTALEWAKLLFSLNPNDPYGMKYFIHTLAIRARQAQWLLDFMSTHEFVADETDDTYLKQTLVLAKLQVGDTDGAKIAAVAGMERLPWLYCALFQALNVEAPPPLWGVRPDTNEREFWTNLYIHQAKDIWNNTQAIDVLKEAVKIAQKPTQALPEDLPADNRTARWTWLEDTPTLLSGIPRAMLAREPNYAFDPLPPPKEENIFTSQGVQMPWRQSGENGEQGMLAQERALINMLRRQQQRAAARGAGAGAAGGAGAMGAMMGAFPDDDDEEEGGDFGDAWEGAFSDGDDDDLEGDGRQPPSAGVVQRLADLLASMIPGGWPAESTGGGDDSAGPDDDEELPPLIDGDNDIGDGEARQQQHGGNQPQ